MEEKHGVNIIFLFFIYLELFLIYCMDVVFLKLFLLIYYCSIVYENFVFQKIRNPNGAYRYKRNFSMGSTRRHEVLKE